MLNSNFKVAYNNECCSVTEPRLIQLVRWHAPDELCIHITHYLMATKTVYKLQTECSKTSGLSGFQMLYH